ncbi:MAG: hypothetical protein ACFB0G_11250 [Leptolyngbyaceae cyanobacterium]
MPLTDISARKIRVFIGADNQDWSDSAGRFVPGKDSLGEVGAISCTATLEILGIPGTNPESIDPENNPSRWRPGQLVRVQIEDDSGSYVPHPQGWLYMRREPVLTEAEGTGIDVLSIELGDWLAWGDSQEPADDVSAVALGTAEDTSVIAQRYLEASGIPSASIALGGPWGYSVALPQTKPQGSYVSKAAELAYASGYRVLYQDMAGIVRSQVVTTTAKATPDLTLDLNTQKLRFARFPDGQEPFEVIRVAGIGETVTQVATPLETGVGTPAYTSEAHDVTEDTIVTRGTSISADPNRTASRTTRSRVEQPGEEVFDVGGSAIPVVTGDNTQILYYQAPPDADDGEFPYRLFRSFSYDEKAAGLIDGDDDAIPERFRETQTLREFDTDGRVIKLTEIQWGREKEFDPDGGIAWRQILESIQEWIKEGDGIYAYKSSVKAARITLNQRASALTPTNKWQLINARPPEFRPATGRGENEPPSAEEWEGPFYTNTQDYQGEVTWVHRGGATGRSRTRTFLLPQGLAFSVAQCEAIAAMHRDLLAGRQRGRLIQLALSDALLAIDTPLPELEVLCLDGWTRTYLLDSPTWEHQSDRSFCEAIGILIKEVAP